MATNITTGVYDELYDMLSHVLRQRKRVLEILAAIGLAPSQLRDSNTTLVPLYVIYYRCCKGIDRPTPIAKAAGTYRIHAQYYLRRLKHCNISKETCHFLQAKLNV